MGLEDDLEFVNFPTEDNSSNGQYKVLQLYLGEKPVMVFGAVSTIPAIPHFEILKAFLEERGIAFETMRSSRFTPEGVPEIGGKGQPYHVVGGGFNSMYVKNKTFGMPEGGSSFHGSVNDEHSAIFEKRMLKEGWTRSRFST